MKKCQVKVFLKRKSKRHLCIFSHHGFPYPWYKVHILTRKYEKKSSNFGDYVRKWDVDSSSRISPILAIFFMQFVNKLLLSGVIVSLNRWIKYIIVTYRSPAGRFTVECKEYGNTLFSCFDFFIYVSSTFTLNSRIKE